ncbi:MAG: LysR substrate-binding domain-containing protein [Polyangiales bacterium]
MLDTLRGYYVFAQVAETGSFSRAAERLEITKSAVSKHVAQLEAALAVQLIVRTTRKLVLTDAGERVYAACARIAGDVEAAREAAQDASASVAGKLRITAPVALGTNYLMPLVTEFLARHPKLAIDLLIADSFVDIVSERVDIALRVGGPSEPSAISRRLASVDMTLIGAPSYFAKAGEPRTPAELAQHPWIMHTPSAGSAKLVLQKGHKRATVPMQGRLSGNHGPSNLAAARAGHGILVAPDFEVAHELRAGTLVRVLPEWTIERRVLQMIFPPRQHVLGRVRAFADFMLERLRDPPWRLPDPSARSQPPRSRSGLS